MLLSEEGQGGGNETEDPRIFLSDMGGGLWEAAASLCVCVCVCVCVCLSVCLSVCTRDVV